MNWKHLISHRGNIDGIQTNKENHPDYIDIALKKGYEVEIDLHIINEKLWLGHDNGEHCITWKWLKQRKEKLWIHCKNIEAIVTLNSKIEYRKLHYFWHEEDTMTITSHGYLWVFPGKQPIANSIAVLPEKCLEITGKEEDLSLCIGICSDFIGCNKRVST